MAAGIKGVSQALERLQAEAAKPLTIYLYPTHASKKSLTENGGDGHAVPSSRVLHAVVSSGLESLIAHEATHILAPEAWGPMPTPLLAEGAAVWASGQYAGRTLAQLKDDLAGIGRSSVVSLLNPKGFRSIPEKYGYPIGGLLFETLLAEVGLAKASQHLATATAATWDDACTRAGTTAADIEAAFSKVLAAKP
jgi:hypothetical protein